MCRQPQGNALQRQSHQTAKPPHPKGGLAVARAPRQGKVTSAIASQVTVLRAPSITLGLMVLLSSRTESQNTKYSVAQVPRLHGHPRSALRTIYGASARSYQETRRL